MSHAQDSRNRALYLSFVRLGPGRRTKLGSDFSTSPLNSSRCLWEKERGFFREEGIQAEFVRIVPTVALAAMASGEIDYYTSIGSGVAGMLRGLPIKIVSCYVPSAPITIISRPEFKSVVELRGKTIGINTYGSPLEVIGKLIIKHFGLDP